ncbi:hypothetical protein [Microvirga roseola]|uniref:hypothetical protein n=1 Tax=Microvirga roseola TaxID=2883126 RepID=UPI001E3B8BF2|nr:hypothetical protein [Microvirga roseola]
MQRTGLDESAVAARLGLKMAMANASPEISAGFLVDLWKAVGAQEQTVEEFLATGPQVSVPLLVRGLLWLAKFDLIRITEADRA